MTWTSVIYMGLTVIVLLIVLPSVVRMVVRAYFQEKAGYQAVIRLLAKGKENKDAD